jgi:hypothetical protein
MHWPHRDRINLVNVPSVPVCPPLGAHLPTRRDSALPAFGVRPGRQGTTPREAQNPEAWPQEIGNIVPVPDSPALPTPADKGSGGVSGALRGGQGRETECGARALDSSLVTAFVAGCWLARAREDAPHGNAQHAHLYATRTRPRWYPVCARQAGRACATNRPAGRGTITCLRAFCRRACSLPSLAEVVSSPAAE